MTKDMTITEIRALTLEDLRNFETEIISVKEHNCYFVDLGGAFGYSVLVFKNKKHIYFANDYQLHHQSKTLEELKQWYIDTLNRKLFTEAELMENVTSYDNYTSKRHYLANYWIMQFNHISPFYIGKPSEEQEKAKEKMLFCRTCYSYVEDKSIIDRANKLMNNIEKSYNELQKDDEVFRKMISYELANHEAGYTGECGDTLYYLGLKFDELSEPRQKIVKQELSNLIEKRIKTQ